jgi:ATP/maltotriose-dependent transcriptional regulator MalT/DNA-binding SARP family transcriptional activator
MKKTSLAKLTRPKLHNVCMRERLFALLDAGRTRSAIWIVGPPGAGKTTLVASYLEANNLSGIWYQIDGSDQDISTFFYYLALAAAESKAKHAPRLPLLTPEYLTNLSGFARHYFRQLFAQLKAPAVLTLDNYHELPASSVFHEVLEQALAEVPDGVTVIIISRNDPPKECARAEALERLTRLEWDALRLTLEETAAIAASRHEIEPSALRTLHQQCNGWAAGLTLTLEGLKRVSSGHTSIDGEALESVFNYFAGQIMKGAAPQTEELLVRTALLPRMTAAMAEQLTGNSAAAGLLEQFYRRRLFTDRRGSVYQYHDLFRAFLLQQFTQTYTEVGQRKLYQQAGQVLEDASEFEDAHRLYRAAHDWDAVARLILAQAAKLLEQGRGETLREWIDAMPTSMRDEMPWLSYWRGASLIQVEPEAAREPLSRSFEQFAVAQDALGRIMACTGMILTYYAEFANMTPLDPWIDALLGLLDAAPEFPSPASELKVNAVLVFALTFRRPQLEPLRKCVARTSQLLAENVTANDKVIAAIFLLAYLYRLGTAEEVTRHIRELEPTVNLDEVAAVNKAMWLRSVGYFFWYASDLRASETALRAAIQTATDNAVTLRSIHGLGYWALAGGALERGDIAAAESLRAKAATYYGPWPMQKFYDARLRSMLAVHKKDRAGSVRFAELAAAAAEEAGVVHLQFLARIWLAITLIDSMRCAASIAPLSEARELIAHSAFILYECQVKLVEAYSALRQGDAVRCDELLRSAFLHSDPDDYLQYHCVRSHPALLSELFGEALSAQIEVQRVVYLIYRLDVSPSNKAPSNWPWPVRIFALGHFEVLIDGVPLEFSRKTPKKPLQLLKALIAFGSTEVPEQKIIDALWPDEMGDSAHNAFTMALNRLRKLLAVPDAIQHHAGRLSIDRCRCWIDAAALEKSMDLTSETTDVAEHVLRAVDLYRGRLLDDEGETPWAARARERFRHLFVQRLLACGRWMEQAGEYDSAAMVYRRGIEADDLAEELYRGLMRCYDELGQRAEAMNAYRRLRQTLSITLGIAPGAATEELAKRVQQGPGSD